MKVRVEITGHVNVAENDYNVEDFGYDPDTPLGEVITDIIEEELEDGTIDPINDLEDVSIQVFRQD